ncbi:hypothetical protein PR002_g18893 [Phytophthora rubi]|uniref:Uncharacterized protein n=1 Tax=Phytophthora rubi TaxID=129364 RepID=A0A6A3JSU1_9STRA|nr:hypothetical protein PR002_g18893 [Phytophthora rubi]
MYEEPDVCEGDGIISRKSAVLREGADILQSNDAGLSNAVVDSFLETIHAPSVSTCDAKDAELQDNASRPDVIPIERSVTSITEWTANGEMLAGAFPTLFMTGGAMLPKGSLPKGATLQFKKLHGLELLMGKHCLN